jgi:hypothetical protein
VWQQLFGQRAYDKPWLRSGEFPHATLTILHKYNPTLYILYARSSHLSHALARWHYWFLLIIFIQSEGGGRTSTLETALGFVPRVLFLMRLAHVLLPCVSECFSAVDSFRNALHWKSKDFFFAPAVDPLTSTVHLWLASSICGGLVCFEYSALTTLRQQNKIAMCTLIEFAINFCMRLFFCYAMRNFLRFSGLSVMSSTLFFNVPPPTYMFFNLFAVANSAFVLPLRTLIIRLQASMRCIYCTSCPLCFQNTPHLRQNARGGVCKKRRSLYNKDVVYRI